MTRAGRRGFMVAAALAAGLATATGAFAQAAAATAASAVAASEPRIQPIMGCQPWMPASAVNAHATGTTHLRFQVDTDGHVTEAEIVQSAGVTRAHHLLDEAAKEALSRCPFRPARDENGQPRAGVVVITYTWRFE